MDIGCIVLAGGKGLRFGSDKILEIIGARSLLERVVSSISSFGSDVIIVSGVKQSFPQFTDYPRLRIVTDTYTGKGPLGGIYTGLAASNSWYNLVVAGDMPFLNQDFLRYMIQLSPSYDLVVPRWGKMVEPLHAIYSKSCLTPIENLLKKGEMKVSQLFTLVKVRYVEADEINRFDPEHLSFFNINTEADLEKARELVKGDNITDDKC